MNAPGSDDLESPKPSDRNGVVSAGPISTPAAGFRPAALKPGSWAHVSFALALLSPVAACFLEAALWPLIHPYIWYLFYPAVFISSWLGGRRAGIAATVMATALVWWFFAPPAHALVKPPAEALPALVFLATGVLFSTLHDRLRSATAQAFDALRASESAKLEVSRLCEQTKAIDAVKALFFAGVSHDLRTPLTLILSPAERLIASADTPAAARADLATIVRNGRTLLHHVNNLLDVAKMETVGMDLTYVATDLAELVRFVASHFEGAAAAAHQTFRVDTPNELRAEIDAEKVQRILFNLLANAFKFTPPDGTIRLALRAEDDHAVIEVEDGGPGIPDKDRVAVFEPFRQVAERVSHGSSGTGLGLSIARSFALLHKGTIEATSGAEGGARLVVTLPKSAPAGVIVDRTEPAFRSSSPSSSPSSASLPLSDVAREAVRQVSDAKSHGRDSSVMGVGPLVLVVEDNSAMRQFLCEGLADRHRVVVACDGDEGLQRAKAMKPDLILTDLMMPRMTGEEFLRAVRADPDLSGTPVVVVSAKADDAERIRLLRNGAQEYVAKPFLLPELCARVDLVLSAKLAEQEERGRAQRAIQAREIECRNVLMSAPEGVLILDPHRTVIFANPRATASFGYKANELVGLPIDVLVPDRLPAKDGRLRHSLYASPTGEPLRSDLEGVGRRKDGREFFVELSFSPSERDDGCSDLVVFVRDITRRRETQDQLREYQEMLQRATFEASVVQERERHQIAVELHDRIGQSLALAQMKLSDAAGMCSAAPCVAVMQSIELIQESVAATRSLMFDLSPPVLYDLGLEAALLWLVEDLENRLGQRVTLRTTDADIPLDYTRAAVVFRSVRELLMNAYKHSRVKAATVSVRATGAYVEIDVDDDGAGFDMDRVPKASSSRGFGLFSVREQIRQLGGEFRVTSAPEQGTHVAMRVPLTSGRSSSRRLQEIATQRAPS